MNSLSYFTPLVFLDLTWFGCQQRGCQLKKGLLPLKRKELTQFFIDHFFSKTRPPRKQHHRFVFSPQRTPAFGGMNPHLLVFGRWFVRFGNQDAVYKAWGQSQFKMKAIVGQAMTGADPDEVQAFFESHPCDSVESCWYGL